MMKWILILHEILSICYISIHICIYFFNLILWFVDLREFWKLTHTIPISIAYESIMSYINIKCYISTFNIYICCVTFLKVLYPVFAHRIALVEHVRLRCRILLTSFIFCWITMPELYWYSHKNFIRKNFFLATIFLHQKQEDKFLISLNINLYFRINLGL